MHIPKNIGKSTLLAMCVFWTINFTEDFNWDFIPFVLLSVIPICICVTAVVIGTICPVFWAFKKEDESNTLLFKSYFPYYIILVFSLCLFGVFASDYKIYSISFFITVFITTAQSWVWFAKEK